MMTSITLSPDEYNALYANVDPLKKGLMLYFRNQRPIALPERNQRGVDLSRHNGLVDFLAAKTAGVSFAYVRRTMGATGVDERGRLNTYGLRAMDIPDAVYHFVVPPVEPISQMDNLEREIGMDFGVMPLVMDVERRRDASGVPEPIDRRAFTARLRLLLNDATQRWSHRPYIYTSLAEWSAMTEGAEDLEATYQFVVAQYAPKLTAVKPGWNVVCWQYRVGPWVGFSDRDVDQDLWLGDNPPAPQPTPIPTPSGKHNFAPLKNQAVINLFRDASHGAHIEWITRAQLSGVLYPARDAVYSGIDIEDLPGLSDLEKAALIAQLGLLRR